MADVIMNRFAANLANKEIDFEVDTVRCALLKTTYTPDKDDSTWADVSANEVVGSGYTTKGVIVANCAVTQDDTNDLTKLDGDDPTFSAVTLTGANAPQYAVLFDDTVGTDDIICIWDFGSGVDCNGGDFVVELDANGILKLEQGT